MDTHWQGESPAAGLQDARPPASGTSHRDTAPERQAPQVVASMTAPRAQEKDLSSAIIAWGMAANPSPMLSAAQVLAFTIIGGIAGRSYNIEGTGTNQYYHLIAPSGTGKGMVLSGFGKLFAETAKCTPAILELKGPGNLASGAGILTWLSEAIYPIAVCVFDEWGNDIEEMANPRNPNGRAKEKALNQVWPLSGKGKVLDGKAHSDSTKNLGALNSPALTIAGTGTPDRFNEMLASSLAVSGLFSRVVIVEHTGDIPPLNEGHKAAFDSLPVGIVSDLADLAATALTLAQNGQVNDVGLCPDARQHFRDYAEYLRQRRNRMGNGPARELLNRNREKALKLAATLAIGQNWHFPVVTLAMANFATDFIEQHTNSQVAKFDTGDVGEQAGNQVKQDRELKRVIAEYCMRPWSNKYHGTREMHADYIITKAHIQQRLSATAAFRDDRLGAKSAIERSIKSLTEADIIREIPRAQMVEKFNKQCFAYQPSDPDAIIASL